MSRIHVAVDFALTIKFHGYHDNLQKRVFAMQIYHGIYSFARTGARKKVQSTKKYLLSCLFLFCIYYGGEKKWQDVVVGGQLQILGGLSRSTILLHIVHRFSKGVDGKRKKCVCL